MKTLKENGALMKTLLFLSPLLLTFLLTDIHASGSSVGNGFVAESILKGASMDKSKSSDKLCADAGGKIEKEGKEENCKLKDGSIKMKDLIEAAKKNDSVKK